MRSQENIPKIVVVGGGTGLSTMLRGLKKRECSLTAIVTVADDGGSSGFLRTDQGILPPGDIRNCMVALAEVEPLMEELLQFRFKEGSLKGQCFGNLFLVAMAGISDNFEDAVRKMSGVLAVKGKVLPVTLDDIRIKAELDDGITIYGETNIGKCSKKDNCKISKIIMEPENASINPEAATEIRNADLIVLGPGSLFTSIIPNLLVKNVVEEINNSKAVKVYICNVMTQPGETNGLDASMHYSEVVKYLKRDVDYILLNESSAPEVIYERYLQDGAELVDADKGIYDFNVTVIKDDFICTEKGYVRHSPEKLADTLLSILRRQQHDLK